MEKKCWICNVLFVWKYADSIEIKKEEEYKKELLKIYAKAKYQGSFLKMIGIALGFIYFLIRDHNQDIFWLTCLVGSALVVLLLIEACRIFYLARCIELEIMSLPKKDNNS